MKNLISIFLLTIMLHPAFLKAQDINFTVSGKIGNYSSPDKAYLGFYRGGWHVDSSEIKNGKFIFHDHVNRSKLGYLYIRPKGSHIETIAGGGKRFYLEAGSITINSPDSVQNSIASGGKWSADYEAFSSVLRMWNQEIKILPIRNDGSKQKEEFAGRKKILMSNFIQKHLSSQISIDAIQEYISVMKTKADVLHLQNLYHSLAPEVKQSLTGIAVGTVVAHENLRGIGTIAPDFSQADTSGHIVSLHDYRGKFVLIDFWASWCEPCRAENPNMVKAYTRFKSKGLSVLGVSLDNNAENWKIAVREDHLQWAQVSDLKGGENQAAKLFFVDGIPVNLLISPTGEILAKNIFGNELIEKLEDIFSDK